MPVCVIICVLRAESLNLTNYGRLWFVFQSAHAHSPLAKLSLRCDRAANCKHWHCLLALLHCIAIFSQLPVCHNGLHNIEKLLLLCSCWAKYEEHSFNCSHITIDLFLPITILIHFFIFSIILHQGIMPFIPMLIGFHLCSFAIVFSLCQTKQSCLNASSTTCGQSVSQISLSLSLGNRHQIGLNYSHSALIRFA